MIWISGSRTLSFNIPSDVYSSLFRAETGIKPEKTISSRALRAVLNSAKTAFIV